MAKRTQNYAFEELDKKTRDYLLAVRNRQGEGMPGLYIPTDNYLPIAGFLGGFTFLIVMWIIAWNQMEQEPLGVAMLQTVGLLLGGWMIAAAFRTWIAARRDNYAGHFIYADAETLWECTGSTVTATDLIGIVDSEAVTNYNKEGKYQNTAVTVFTKKGGKHTLTMAKERRAQRLTFFLNTLAWLRSGGDKDKGGEDPSELPAAILGGIARENALDEVLPKKWTASALNVEVEEVPIPQRTGKPAWGLFPLAVIVVLGTLSVFAFSRLNVGWRDDAIWDTINDIRYADARAPWLRAYLADARNTKHRDQARQMLRDIYEKTVARIRSGANLNVNLPQFPNPNVGGVNFPQFPNQNVAAGRPDKDLVDGLEVVLLALAEMPLPDVSVSVKDKMGGPTASEREKAFVENYTRGIYEGVGDQLIRIAQAPPDSKGMIDITIEHATVNNSLNATITFTFRKAPDDAVVKTVKKEIAHNLVQQAGAKDNIAAALASIGTQLGLSTAGPKKPPPPAETAGD